MNFYIDCEFNSFQGELISMAIVCDKGELYLGNVNFFKNDPAYTHPWVRENVLPILEAPSAGFNWVCLPLEFKKHISRFFYDKIKEEEITIVADWWTDIEHFCNVMVGDEGSTVTLNKSRKYAMIVDRTIDSYADPLPGSVQHNALWDARNIARAFKNKYGD